MIIQAFQVIFFYGLTFSSLRIVLIRSTSFLSVNDSEAAVSLVKHPGAVTVVIVLNCAGGCVLACSAAVGIAFVGGDGIGSFFDFGQPVGGVVNISACAVTGHIAVVFQSLLGEL